MKQYTLIVSLIFGMLFFTNNVFGQKTTSTDSFIELFKPDTLPTCIEYSYEEQVYFGAVFYTDSVLVEQEDEEPYWELQDIYEEATYERDTTLLLDKAFVKKSLLPHVAALYYLGEKGDTLYSDSIGEYLESGFYPIALLITSKKYYGVVYERSFFSSGIESSEKYLCTFSKKGDFISRILIASFVYSGTGMSSSGARVPWFPQETGCIDKKIHIVFYSELDEKKIFAIKKDGRIVEIKSPTE